MSDPFAGPGPRPPEGLRDASGFLPASAEVAWLRRDLVERPDGVLISRQHEALSVDNDEEPARVKSEDPPADSARVVSHAPTPPRGWLRTVHRDPAR